MCGPFPIWQACKTATLPHTTQDTIHTTTTTTTMPSRRISSQMSEKTNSQADLTFLPTIHARMHILYDDRQQPTNQSSNSYASTEVRIFRNSGLLRSRLLIKTSRVGLFTFLSLSYHLYQVNEIFPLSLPSLSSEQNLSSIPTIFIK